MYFLEHSKLQTRKVNLQIRRKYLETNLTMNLYPEYVCVHMCSYILQESEDKKI